MWHLAALLMFPLLRHHPCCDLPAAALCSGWWVMDAIGSHGMMCHDGLQPAWSMPAVAAPSSTWLLSVGPLHSSGLWPQAPLGPAQQQHPADLLGVSAVALLCREEKHWEMWICAGSWQSLPAPCSLAACVPGVPRGDPLLLQLALIECHSRHRTALTGTRRRNVFSKAEGQVSRADGYKVGNRELQGKTEHKPQSLLGARARLLPRLWFGCRRLLHCAATQGCAEPHSLLGVSAALPVLTLFAASENKAMLLVASYGVGWMGSPLRPDCHVPLWGCVVMLNNAGELSLTTASWHCDNGLIAGMSLMTGCELNDWQAMGLAGWGNWNLTQSQKCPAGKFWLVWERPL